MKSILITGSTDGIGKLAAIQLAKEGHQLYLHGRTEEKVNHVIEEIKKVTSNDKIDGFVADFSDLNKVREMAKNVTDKLSSIDILINNAGVYISNNKDTSNNQDIRFVVNYLAPYILTDGLLPLLRKSKDARIINLSSAAQAEVLLDALTGKIKLSAQAAYAQSKLALTMWSMHLAAQEKNMIVIPVNPGSLLNTKMVKEAFGRYWSSADKGAEILSELALSDDIKSKSGMYFDNDLGRFGKAHEDAYDLKQIDELLEITKMLVQE